MRHKTLDMEIKKIFIEQGKNLKKHIDNRNKNNIIEKKLDDFTTEYYYNDRMFKKVVQNENNRIATFYDKTGDIVRENTLDTSGKFRSEYNTGPGRTESRYFDIEPMGSSQDFHGVFQYYYLGHTGKVGLSGDLEYNNIDFNKEYGKTKIIDNYESKFSKFDKLSKKEKNKEIKRIRKKQEDIYKDSEIFQLRYYNEVDENLIVNKVRSERSFDRVKIFDRDGNIEKMGYYNKSNHTTNILKKKKDYIVSKKYNHDKNIVETYRFNHNDINFNNDVGPNIFYKIPYEKALSVKRDYIKPLKIGKNRIINETEKNGIIRKEIYDKNKVKKIKSSDGSTVFNISATNPITISTYDKSKKQIRVLKEKRDKIVFNRYDYKKGELDSFTHGKSLRTFGLEDLFDVLSGERSIKINDKNPSPFRDSIKRFLNEKYTKDTKKIRIEKNKKDIPNEEINNTEIPEKSLPHKETKEENSSTKKEENENINNNKSDNKIENKVIEKTEENSNAVEETKELNNEKKINNLEFLESTETPESIQTTRSFFKERIFNKFDAIKKRLLDYKEKINLQNKKILKKSKFKKKKKQTKKSKKNPYYQNNEKIENEITGARKLEEALNKKKGRIIRTGDKNPEIMSKNKKTKSKQKGKTSILKEKDGSMFKHIDLGNDISVGINFDANGKMIAKQYVKNNNGYFINYGDNGNIIEGFRQGKEGWSNVVRYDKDLNPTNITTNSNFNLDEARELKEEADKAWKNLGLDGINDILPNLNYKPKPEPEQPQSDTSTDNFSENTDSENTNDGNTGDSNDNTNSNNDDSSHENNNTNTDFNDENNSNNGNNDNTNTDENSDDTSEPEPPPNPDEEQISEEEKARIEAEKKEKAEHEERQKQRQDRRDRKQISERDKEYGQEWQNNHDELLKIEEEYKQKSKELKEKRKKDKNSSEVKKIEKEVAELKIKKQKQKWKTKQSERKYNSRNNEYNIINDINSINSENTNLQQEVDNLKQQYPDIDKTINDLVDNADEIGYNPEVNKLYDDLNNAKNKIKKNEKKIFKNKEREKSLKNFYEKKFGSKRKLNQMNRKQILKGFGINEVFTLMNTVSTYKDQRREGHGVISSSAKAGGELLLSESLGFGQYMALSLMRELPTAVVKGSSAIFQETRRMNSASRFQIFGDTDFQDTQQLATMRQSGMELAKMSQYRLEQTLMGNEARYLHK